MRQFFGMSQCGNLKEAVRGLSRPQLLILLSNSEQFKIHVRELEELFPQVPSIGCIGVCYGAVAAEKGVGVVALLDGAAAVADVLEQASLAPVKYVGRLKRDLERVGGTRADTVCLDFCTGSGTRALTTLSSVLGRKKIAQIGAAGEGGLVSANGRIYEDAMVYALVRSLHGRVKVYKENIYRQMGEERLVTSGTNRAEGLIGALNGQSAKLVYQNLLHVPERDLETQTFRNPLGRLDGEETDILAVREASGSALRCYRPVGDCEVLTVLELGDYPSIVRHTVQTIRRDFSRPSAVFSINCLLRYLLFRRDRYLPEYLREMGSLGCHAGFVGCGEHYNGRLVNQTMVCAVFE